MRAPLQSIVQSFFEEARAKASLGFLESLSVRYIGYGVNAWNAGGVLVF